MEYKQMYKLIPKVDSENFKIFYKVFTEEQVKIEKLRNIWDIYKYMEVANLQAGTYVVLCNKKTNEIIMSDTAMEQDTNREFIRKSNGNVLIAGLGIGLIILPIQEKKEVKSITIIEKSKELIDLITPYLPLNKKVKIICADIFEWKPKKDKKWDTIYFDIWNKICGDYYEEIKKLNLKFKYKLNRENPNYWLSSWRIKDFKRLNYDDRRY